MDQPEAGLLGPAYRWSAVLAVGSLAAWLTLTVLDLGRWSTGDVGLSRPWHVLHTSLLVAIVCCLVVHVTARVMRGQRNLAVLIDSPGRGYPAGYLAGLAAQPETDAVVPFRRPTPRP